MAEKKTHRKHTKEFVADAIKQVVTGGKKVSEVAKSLGIHENMLRKWIKNSQKPAAASPAASAEAKAKPDVA